MREIARRGLLAAGLDAPSSGGVAGAGKSRQMMPIVASCGHHQCPDVGLKAFMRGMGKCFVDRCGAAVLGFIGAFCLSPDRTRTGYVVVLIFD